MRNEEHFGTPCTVGTGVSNGDKPETSTITPEVQAEKSEHRRLLICAVLMAFNLAFTAYSCRRSPVETKKPKVSAPKANPGKAIQDHNMDLNDALRRSQNGR